ncbi:hypothetical protein [Butyrivibrio fibrisolvens]|nr:hypothetical protein [Butyrivibrio fibrisolvens]
MATASWYYYLKHPTWTDLLPCKDLGYAGLSKWEVTIMKRGDEYG